MRDFNMDITIQSIEAGRLNPPAEPLIDTAKYCDCVEWTDMFGQHGASGDNEEKCPFCNKEMINE